MLKKYILLLSLTGIALLAGCGDNTELAVFQESVQSFYTEVSDIEDAMNNINNEEEDAVTTMLICMEQMSSQFEVLADLKVPLEFSSVEKLADDASEYMTEAVKLYTRAYEEAGKVNEPYIQAAIENYDSAMKRIGYIAALLQGEIPEGAVVVEGDGNEFEPYSEE